MPNPTAAQSALNENAATLYAAICKLSYTETRMSTDPLRPFGLKDKQALSTQGDEAASSAKSFRSHLAGQLDQAKIIFALGKVKAAQVMFDAININVKTSFSADQVKSATEDAIEAVNVC
jgi:hypothetical protein